MSGPITDFDGVHAHVATLPPARLAVAGGDDAAVIAAVLAALDRGMLARATLFGRIATMAPEVPAHLSDRIALVGADTPQACAEAAVAEIRAGRADILMKGHVDSTAYLRAIVNRETGIRGPGALSNVTVAAINSYPRLLAVTDNGILPSPSLDQKRGIIRNTAPLFAGLGIDPVRVAAIAATEKVSDAMRATTDARALASDARAGRLPGFVVDGPFGYDVAVSPAAAAKKGLATSPVAGRADLILCDGIETANALAKSWKLHGAARSGSIVLGARAPVLLNSRSDAADRRIDALALAILIADAAQTAGADRTTTETEGTA